ncbi:MAG: hypothetical protein IIY98_03920 [Aeriscardovia sp.]|nr:hypothetical protein [Aeriscardovia sp.]
MILSERSAPGLHGHHRKSDASRMLLMKAMTAHGFQSLAEERQHFTLADKAYPDTYFPFFPVNRDSLSKATVSNRKGLLAFSLQQPLPVFLSVSAAPSQRSCLRSRYFTRGLSIPATGQIIQVISHLPVRKLTAR